MPYFNSFPQPTRKRRALLLGGLPALVALGLVGSPFAQSTPGAVEGPRGPHPRMHRPGPVSPQFLRDSIGVTGAKLDQYNKRYQSYMAQTKPARDSLQSAMRSIRTAFESGDRGTARNRRQAVRRQAEQLIKQDRDFEAGLKDILSPDQQKRYSEWKEQRIKLARERRQEGRRGHGHTTSSDSAGS
jgi:Spy/CpxP family protein refolding chaperone